MVNVWIVVDCTSSLSVVVASVDIVAQWSRKINERAIRVAASAAVDWLWFRGNSGTDGVIGFLDSKQKFDIEELGLFNAVVYDELILGSDARVFHHGAVGSGIPETRWK
ncbi:hypothetical protein QA600_21425 [Natronococcus sp. A-GB1]|uniref:hypothetical protein n=1 Tax=Natronococcus sp. A-GB1 TaxID=3037648 RepID=UPI00241F9080|nr:hypothetical protein [Natronococcus sp. A-GB1]MDG5761886.1 hypothetical protein [Natronococcus sp. A-GB1]